MQRVTEERLNQAVERILALKQKYLYFAKAEKPLSEVVCTKAHLALAKRIAEGALYYSSQVSLSGKKVLWISPLVLQESLKKVVLPKDASLVCFSEGRDAKVHVIEEQLPKKDAVLFFSHNAWKEESIVQQTLIKCLLEKNTPLVAVVTRDEKDTKLFGKTPYLLTRSPTLVSLQVAVDFLYQ